MALKMRNRKEKRTIMRSKKLGVGKYTVTIIMVGISATKSGTEVLEIEVRDGESGRKGIFLIPIKSKRNYPLLDQLLDSLYPNDNIDNVEIDIENTVGCEVDIEVVENDGFLNINSFKESSGDNRVGDEDEAQDSDIDDEPLEEYEEELELEEEEEEEEEEEDDDDDELEIEEEEDYPQVKKGVGKPFRKRK